jgi:hypothetical protein
MPEKRATKALTPREFVLNLTCCPRCGAEVHDWNSFDVVDGSAYQQATCGECGTNFTAIYRLVGFMMEPNWEAETIAEDFDIITPHAKENPCQNVKYQPCGESATRAWRRTLGRASLPII